MIVVGAAAARNEAFVSGPFGAVPVDHVRALQLLLPLGCVVLLNVCSSDKP